MKESDFQMQLRLLDWMIPLSGACQQANRGENYAEGVVLFPRALVEGIRVWCVDVSYDS